MLLESRNSVSSIGSEVVHSSFLNMSCSGWKGGELYFLFGKFKARVKTYLDFKL